MKKLISIILIIALSASSLACSNLDPYAAGDGKGESSYNPSSANETESAMEDEKKNKDGVDVFFDARKKTDSLAKIEYLTKVYSKQGTGELAPKESIDMRTVITSRDTKNPKFTIEGNVKTSKATLSLVLKYAAGVLYINGDKKTTEEKTTFEKALKDNDVLYDLKQQLKKETIDTCKLVENADGTKVISVTFKMEINKQETNGTDEVIIDADGIIVSEALNLSAKDKDGVITAQSVEYTLIGTGKEVKDIK